MARKYIVASATIVRITAENLSVFIFRYAHQATTRNADRSELIFLMISNSGKSYANGRQE